MSTRTTNISQASKCTGSAAVKDNKRTREIKDTSSELSEPEYDSSSSRKRPKQYDRAFCEQCHKWLCNTSSLRTHMKNIHEKHFECSVKSCHQFFSLEAERDKHSNSCYSSQPTVAGLQEVGHTPFHNQDYLRQEQHITTSHLTPNWSCGYNSTNGHHTGGTLEVNDLDTDSNGLLRTSVAMNKQALQHGDTRGPSSCLKLKFRLSNEHEKVSEQAATQARARSEPQQLVIENPGQTISKDCQHLNEISAPKYANNNQQQEVSEVAPLIPPQDAQVSTKQMFPSSECLSRIQETPIQSNSVLYITHTSKEEAPSLSYPYFEQENFIRKTVADDSLLNGQHHCEELLPLAFQIQQPFSEKISRATIEDAPIEGAITDSQDKHTLIGCLPVKATKDSHQLPKVPDFAILEEYEEQKLLIVDVVENLDRIMESIADYDEYIRGKDKDSSQEVRNQLKVLDRVTPLADLYEVTTEPRSIFGQRSSLLLLLRSMFDVPPYSTLDDKLTSIGTDIKLLPLSVIIRGCLAYLIMWDIFDAPNLESGHMKAALSTSMREFHGIETARKLTQYIMLKALKESNFQQGLRSRAYQLAASFYDILYPLTHWLPHSPKNTKEQHIKKLTNITFISLKFAAELQSRIGKFSFYWPKSGEQFEPTMHEVDTVCQLEICDQQLPGTNVAKRKQTVICATMFAVKRVMPGKHGENRYAAAKVVMRTPYAL